MFTLRDSGLPVMRNTLMPNRWSVSLALSKKVERKLD